MRSIEPSAGSHIDKAIEEALVIANETKEPCSFTFNDTEVVVKEGDHPADVYERWHGYEESTAHDAYLKSPEHAAAVAKEEQRTRQARVDFAAQVEKLKSATEPEMRDIKMGWPISIQELNSLIVALTERSHDYGTCVYAMSIAAEAAHNYVAHVLGVTGFQSSCADLDFLRRTRLLNGPFAIIKAEDLLYPQYDIYQKVQEMVGEWRPWASERAKELLAEKGHAADAVKTHWERLAEPVSE